MISLPTRAVPGMRPSRSRRTSPVSGPSTASTNSPRSGCARSSSARRRRRPPPAPRSSRSAITTRRSWTRPASRPAPSPTGGRGEAAVYAAVLPPARPELDRIGAAKTRAYIARLFGTIGFATLFDINLNPDFKNPNRYAIFISQSSLGLPDRDYYLKDDPQLKALREKYVAYVAQMLTLGGSSDPH